MSSNPFTLGDSTPAPGDAQAALDALKDFSPLLAGAAVVLGLVSVPPRAEPLPDNPVLALDHLSGEYRKALYNHLVSEGTWSWWATVLSYIADAIVFGFGLIPSVIFWVAEVFGPGIVQVALRMIEKFRATIDVPVAETAVLVLNELLGQEYSVVDVPTGSDYNAHRDRAQQIGGLYIRNIIGSVATSTDLETVDGFAGVSRFTGLIVNFGIATALLGLAGELGTLGFIKDFRLIGEQVSSGLGLSKQMRIAIKPLLKTLVATPFQWRLNQTYHPQRFSVAEVVNPFAQTIMDPALIARDLELQGWSPDRAAELIKLHQKRLTVEEVETLRRWTLWTEDRARAYVKDLGWPEELVDTLLSLPELKRIDARLLKIVDAMETRVNDGHLSVEEFKAFLATVPMTQHERDVIVDGVSVQAKTPHKSLTLAEIQAALEQGIYTLDDFDARVIALGMSGPDEEVFRTLTLLKMASLAEAKKVAQFAYDKKVATAKAKHLPIPPPPAILG